MCLTPGDLPGASEEAGCLETGADLRGEVSRGHSRRLPPPKARTMSDEGRDEERRDSI